MRWNVVGCAVLLVAMTGCDVQRLGGGAGVQSGNERAETPTGGKPGGTLVRWHYAGAEACTKDGAQGTRVKAVLKERSTQALLQEALGKMAQAVAQGATNAGPQGGEAAAGRVRSLLGDLMAAESRGEWAVGVGQAQSVGVAARLSGAQREEWSAHWSNLVTLCGGGVQGALRVGGWSGWESKWPSSKGWCRWGQAGEWTVVGFGAGEATVFDKVLAGGGDLLNTNDWLGVQVNLPRVAEVLGWGLPVRWPEADLHVFGRGADVRMTGRLRLSEDLNYQWAPWRMPTNTISDPLISFTAVRGLRNLVKELAVVRELGMSQLPDSVFGWALASIPFQTFVSWEWPEGRDSLPSVAAKAAVVATNRLPGLTHGKIEYKAEEKRVVWTGMPILQPFLTGASEKDAGYVLGGVFPPPRRYVAGPQELYAEVVKNTNVLYLDWEITQKRMDDWRQLKNLYWMLSGYIPPNTNHAAQRWLADTNITRKLENAMTEVSVVSGRELAVRRTSSIGLTGFELVMLLRWVDDPGFPRWTQPELARTKRMRAPGTPRPSSAVPRQAPRPTNAPAAKAGASGAR